MLVDLDLRASAVFVRKKPWKKEGPRQQRNVNAIDPLPHPTPP